MLNTETNPEKIFERYIDPTLIDRIRITNRLTQTNIEKTISLISIIKVNR